MKKQNKFECTVCGLKQQLRKVYAGSNKGAECRRVAQAYNTARGCFNNENANDLRNQQAEQGTAHTRVGAATSQPAMGAKWTTYTDDADEQGCTIPVPARRSEPQPGRRKRQRAEPGVESCESHLPEPKAEHQANARPNHLFFPTTSAHEMHKEDRGRDHGQQRSIRTGLGASKHGMTSVCAPGRMPPESVLPGPDVVPTGNPAQTQKWGRFVVDDNL